MDNCISIARIRFITVGFRRNKFTIDAADELTRKNIKAVDNKSFAQATLCDLSKVFDCVEHDVNLMWL